MTNNAWTSEELRAIAAARELELQSLRAMARSESQSRSGSSDRGTTCTCGRGAAQEAPGFAGWPTATRATSERAAVDKDVVFVEAQDKSVNAAIDVAYRAKYGDSRYATAMVTEPARSTKIKLLPR
jgi:hypothetical protein